MNEWLGLGLFLVTQLIGLGIFLGKLYARLEVHDAQIKMALSILSEIRDFLRVPRG